MDWTETHRRRAEESGDKWTIAFLSDYPPQIPIETTQSEPPVVAPPKPNIRLGEPLLQPLSSHEIVREEMRKQERTQRIVTAIVISLLLVGAVLP